MTSTKQYQHGFTLIEVLMALSIFAMISTLAYSSLDIAGNGFAILKDIRLSQEKSGWIGKQLHQDMRYLSPSPHQPIAKPGMRSSQQSIVPIRIKNDNRGDIELDELWLLVHEPGQNSIHQVHYYIDENTNHLMRDSRSLLARENIEAIHWDFGPIRSWAIDILDQDGNWRQDWNFNSQAFRWPKAIKVTVKIDKQATIASQRQWLMAVFPGQKL